MHGSVVTVERRLDGQGVADAPLEELAPGAYTLEVRVLDDAGNQATAAIAFEVAAAPGSPAEPPTEDPPQANQPEGCGCASTPAGGWGVFGLLMWLGVVRRRR